MRLGLVTPVLTLLPRAHAKWEREATFADVVAIAEAADRLGYHHLTCSEHVAVPADIAEVRGACYWDPLATFGYLAARTTRIRLATHVLVLGYHHPLEIAKRYGTLDQVCDGRLILGLGVGSLREEFDLLGVPFDDRGDRADESLRVLRESLSTQRPPRYPGFVVDPCAQQAHVPIWVGGRTARSLRRAVERADGWAPFGLQPDELAAMIARAHDTPAWDTRSQPFDLVLQPERALDPTDDADGAARVLTALRDAGATIVNLRLVHHSRDHYLEQIAAMIDLAGPE